MGEFVCSKRELFNLLINGNNIEDYLQENFNLSPEDMATVVSYIQRNLVSKCNERWRIASRIKERFESKNVNWLDGQFRVPLECRVTVNDPNTSGSSGGRPSKPYEASSEKTKKRKNMELIQEYGLDCVLNAYAQELRSMGETEEATIVNIIRTASKNDKKKILKYITENSEDVTPFSKEEALRTFIDLDLNKEQYGKLRLCLADKNCSVFPSYPTLVEAKKMCYPPDSSIIITNISAKVNLQDLLDHTVARILLIDSVYKNSLRKLKLFCKWGCDGSSGQSEYKQVLPEESDLISDANLFIASLVPIRLIDETTNIVVWKNETCSSVRYCRPILLEFAKETPEKTASVVADINNQKQNLSPSLINKNGEVIEITHDLFLTMIDGKVAQVLTETRSSASCTVCGATPRQMNNLEAVRTRDVNESSFQYGLSTLHAWIRSMEMILHISYNLSFEKWSATSPENKKNKDEKKKLVQKRFREEMGLHVDKPRQGTGNSNDGNTARRFFQNYSCSADITGVDVEFIKRMYIILQTMSSGMAINSKKFGEYAYSTAQLYVNIYNWYYMPSSVHKILIHGEKIIEYYAILPIGQLSEDAQESRNKDYKKFRLHHSRKCSRVATNEDVFHTLLYTSDPYISSLRNTSETISKELLDEAKALLAINENL